MQTLSTRISLNHPHRRDLVSKPDICLANGHNDLTAEGYAKPNVVAYFERKAIGGVASITIGEGIVDSERGKSGGAHTVLDDPAAAHTLHSVTDAITRHGAIASVELQHAGMYANRGTAFALKGGTSAGLAYGPVECEIDGRHILPMTDEILEETIETFAKAALFAKQCGFGMVTIHGGHGG
jgi:2,4-dienoyl-CoA reductase-like NADH-dependent reductase (Old Yellow Enzyme family)